MNDVLEFIVTGIRYVEDHPVESLAIVLSLAAVWWTTRRNPLCWPVGFLSVVLYGGVFYSARLYSDALLQIVYAALELYGWRTWLRAPQDEAHDAHPRVAPASGRMIGGGLLAGAVGWTMLGALMSRYTDAALPWVDSGLTAFSLVAQFWMARLVRANWLLWIGVDVIYVGMYLNQGLRLTAGLYLAFIALAVMGWRSWRPARDEPGPSGLPVASP